MSKTSTASKSKWNKANYDEIKLRMPKGKKEELRALALSSGMSVNRYCLDKIFKAEEKKGLI